MPDQPIAPPSDPNARTESLYFRGSPKLREDVEKFGLGRGLTLSSALAVLAERGLEAEANERSVRGLERQVQALTKEVAVLRERDRSWAAMFGSLQGQLRTLRVGKCPSCRNDVTANDYMLVHQCPACREPLTQVLAASTEDFPPALAALVGALGGFLVGGLVGSDSGGSGGSGLGSRPSRPG